ncbi:hypothetical protein PG991_009146 [Apiospora marii]|uniref:Uncharacterized protein n=1 Tax=Apiospora marii TaxID=335849 RepID=A0ABR1RKB9_9PEZI
MCVCFATSSTSSRANSSQELQDESNRQLYLAKSVYLKRRIEEANIVPSTPTLQERHKLDDRFWAVSRSQRRHNAGTGHPSPQPLAGLTGCPPSTKDNIAEIFAVQQRETAYQSADAVAQESPTESLMGFAVDHVSPMCDVVAGNGVAGVVNDFESASAAIGKATAGGSKPTVLEPRQCQFDGGQDVYDSSADVSPNAESEAYGEDIDLNQEMEVLHHGDRDEMLDIPSSTALTQKVDAGGNSTERSWHLQRHAKTSVDYILM